MTFNIVITFVMILVILVLIIKFGMHPGLVMSGVPIIAALLMGFSPNEIAEFIQAGMAQIVSVLCLVVFAILYFGVLHEAGLFTVLVNAIVRRLKGNVYSVLVSTALISFLTQLDGSGTTTALCTIPPMRPVYEKLHISMESLLLVEGLASAAFTMIPWAPSLCEVSAYANVDVYEVFAWLRPVLIFTIALIFVYCILIGRMEIRRGAGVPEGDWEEIRKEALQEEGALKFGKGVAIFDGIVTLVLMASLLSGLVKPIFAFAAGFFLLAIVNFRGNKAQADYLRSKGPMILSLMFVMMGVGVLVGINNGSGAIQELTGIIVERAPGLASHIVLIACVFSIVLTILTAQAKMAVIVPAIITIVAPVGISPVQVVGAVFCSGCVAASINFFSAGSYLALSLVDLEMRDNLRRNFIPIYIFSLLVTAFMLVTGKIPF